MIPFSQVAEKHQPDGPNQRDTPPSPQGRFAAYLPTLRQHGLAIGIIVLATVIGQVGELYHQLGAGEVLDTVNYLAATHHLLAMGQFFDPLRTPGYPVFLAAFLGSGIRAPLFWVMIVQVVVTIITSFVVYVLGWRLSGRRVPAVIAAALCASNVLIAQWERDILSETLSYWLIVVLFLAFEWYLHTRGRLALAAVVAAALIGIMVRPLNIYIPLLLLALCVIQDLRLRRFRQSWRRLALATGAIYLPLLAYMGGNLVVNNFFGITSVTNLNEFGKVLEYQLYDATNDPAFATVKADIDAYAAQSPNVQLDPFTFIFVLHPEYQQDGIGELGRYSRSILLSHPGPVLAGTLTDLAHTINPPINLYAPNNFHTIHGTVLDAHTHPTLEYSSPWKTNLVRLNRYEFWVYPLLPLVVILVGIWWWRRPASVALPVLFALALSIVGDILIIGGLSYDRVEASRLRFPFDWGMFLLVAILAVEGVARLVTRLQKQRTDASAKQALATVAARTNDEALRSHSR